MIKSALILLLIICHSHSLKAEESSRFLVRPEGFENIAFDNFIAADSFVNSLETLFERLQCENLLIDKTVVVVEQFVGLEPDCPNCLLGFRDIHAFCPQDYQIRLTSAVYQNHLPSNGVAGAAGFKPSAAQNPPEIKVSEFHDISVQVDGMAVSMASLSED